MIFTLPARPNNQSLYFNDRGIGLCIGNHDDILRLVPSSACAAECNPDDIFVTWMNGSFGIGWYRASTRSAHIGDY